MINLTPVTPYCSTIIIK